MFIKTGKFAVIVAVLFVSILAQIPGQLNYQGYLTDKELDPLEGKYSIEFFIFDQPEGSEELWSEYHDVNIKNGNFNVILGSVKPIPEKLFDQKDRYLAIKIGDDPIMTPRKRITSVGYAFKAANADRLNGKTKDDFVELEQPDAVSTEMIKDNAIIENKIKPAIISSINNMANDGGNIDLIAGNNITITADNSDKKITISATGGEGSDNLGNHIATNNLKMNGNWISNDGNNEGIFINNDGKVGIGKEYPYRNLDVAGIIQAESNTTGPAIIGKTLNSGDGAYFQAAGESGKGVFGCASNNKGTNTYGGYFISSGIEGRGVYGYALNTGNHKNYGGYFGAKGDSGIGVYGHASNDADVRNYGGYFSTDGKYGCAVFGQANYKGRSVNFGGTFIANGSLGCGIQARGGKRGGSFLGGYGVNAQGRTIGGVLTSVNPIGGYGAVAVSNGEKGIGITSSGDSLAANFLGNVNVHGLLSKSGGLFKIDHPLDPENKYLQHSFVESPDMMNVYNGNVILDSNGEARVKLPDYFEALNKDFRYQLTALGTPGPNLYISREIKNNSFKIAGGDPGMKVSWQVTGIRNDAYAKKHRIKVVVEKKNNEQGRYLAPVEHGLSKSMGIGYDELKKIQKHAELNKERKLSNRKY